MDRTPGIRPRPSFWRRLDIASRRGTPVAIAVLLLLLLAAPLGLRGQSEMRGAVTLACVYFWSLFRPASMTPPLVFALGIVVDLLGYGPMGVSVLTLLLAHGTASRIRRVLVRQGFLLVWLSFAAVALLAATLQWALSSLLTFRLLPIDGAAFQAALSVGLYPALATLLGWTHQTLAEPDNA